MSPKSENTPKAETPEKSTKAPVEKFYKVVFSHRMNTSQTTDVQLSVNGEQLVMQRGVEVIIPARYKEVADNGTYQTFTQTPGQDRKITGTVQVYPYNLNGEATKAEFQKALKDGNKIARDSERMKAAQN